MVIQRRIEDAMLENIFGGAGEKTCSSKYQKGDIVYVRYENQPASKGVLGFVAKIQCVVYVSNGVFSYFVSRGHSNSILDRMVFNESEIEEVSESQIVMKKESVHSFFGVEIYNF